MFKDLYLVSMPIGNLEDISLRAINLLNRTQCILLEDIRHGRKMLDLLKVNLKNKDLIEINEHNEKKESEKIFNDLMMSCDAACLISDAGVPVLSDSGRFFIDKCLQFQIRLHYVGGPSSVTGALITAGMDIENYFFAGFLPRNDKARDQTLKKLKHYKTTIVVMETAYRLGSLLRAIKKNYSPRKKICLAFNLTCPNASHYRGTVGEAVAKYGERKNKENFVLIFSNGANLKNN